MEVCEIEQSLQAEKPRGQVVYWAEFASERDVVEERFSILQKSLTRARVTFFRRLLTLINSFINDVIVEAQKCNKKGFKMQQTSASKTVLAFLLRGRGWEGSAGGAQYIAGGAFV